MTISVKQRKRQEPNCYIYYNDWSGEIISVGNSLRNDCPAPYIISRNENALRILNGELNDLNFLVGIDDEGEERLIKKTEYLRIRKKEEALYLLSKKKKTNWDLRIRLFLKNRKIVIETNKHRIKRLVVQNIKRQIKLNEENKFEFYLIRKNRPDYLLETLEINANELIRNNKMVFNASEGLLFRDISILTQRQFENYYFEILDDEYIEDNSQSTQNTHVWKFVERNRNPHLQITQKQDIITIESLVDSERLDRIGIQELPMPLHIVDGSPDHYIDSLFIDMSRLRVGQVERFKVDFDIEKVDLMFLHPSLRINKRKES